MASRCRHHLRQGEYKSIPLQHVARGVFMVTLPPAGDQPIEYCVKATAADGRELIWPATAPKINQTVVVMPSAS